MRSEQEDVLPLRAGKRQVVRERVGEHDDDRRDDQRHLHGLPEQAEVHRVVHERSPGREREAVRAREERVEVDAVRRDDRDRRDEEHDEPGERQAEQTRRGQVDSASALSDQEAFTSSHIFA